MRSAIPFDSRFDDFNHPTRFHAIGKTPGYKVPAMHINNGKKIHKPLFHWNIADINAPNLIGALRFVTGASWYS
jgi:hypothetical protein